MHYCLLSHAKSLQEQHNTYFKPQVTICGRILSKLNFLLHSTAHFSFWRVTYYVYWCFDKLYKQLKGVGLCLYSLNDHISLSLGFHNPPIFWCLSCLKNFHEISSRECLEFKISWALLHFSISLYLIWDEYYPWRVLVALALAEILIISSITKYLVRISYWILKSVFAFVRKFNIKILSHLSKFFLEWGRDVNFVSWI